MPIASHARLVSLDRVLKVKEIEQYFEQYSEENSSMNKAIYLRPLYS